MSNISFRHIEIDEKDETKNDIGDWKEEKTHVARLSDLGVLTKPLGRS